MKKYIVLFGFLVVFVGLFFAYNNYQKPKQGFKRELITELLPLECDLAKNPCEYDFNGKKILIDITPRPIYMLEELTIKIKNLDKYEHLNAQIYGLNMYMGTISDEFECMENGDYETKVLLSTCQTKIMRFRLELFDGEKSIGLFGDFDVISEWIIS